MKAPQEVSFTTQCAIVDRLRADPVEALSILTNGIVRLQSGRDGWFIAPKLKRPGSKVPGSDLKFWPNENPKLPGFTWGKKDAGNFIPLLQIFHPEKPEAEIWRYCASALAVKEQRGRATLWSMKQAESYWRDGLDRHPDHVDQVRPDFDKMAVLSDPVRLQYPLMPGSRSFLSSYRDINGERVWFDEHELQGLRRRRMRCCKKIGVGAESRFVGGVHPWVPGIMESGPLAIVTVWALEADQLREYGAFGYAVPTTRNYVPDAQLKQLALRFGSICFMGPAGPDGLRWATQSCAQARALGFQAEVFHWPDGTPDGYIPSRVLLNGGQLCVDSDGAVEVLLPPALLEPGLRKVADHVRTEMERSSVTADLIINAPPSILGPDAKLLYYSLLSAQGVGSETRINRERLRVLQAMTKERVDKALRQLQNLSLLMPMRKGVYAVCKFGELPDRVAQQLYDARIRVEEEMRQSKERGPARILSVPGTSVMDELVEADGIF